MQLKDEVAAPTASPSHEEASVGPLADTSVLLVDDNILCCRIGHRMFKELGASVACVTSGDEAIELASAKCFDIIVVDSALGDQSGFEVAKKLRSLGTQPASTAIIALTPTAADGLRDVAADIGVQAILEKPLCGMSVVEAVEGLGTRAKRHLR